MCALTRWGCSSGSAMPRTDVFPYTRQEKWSTTVFRRSFFTQGLKNVCVALKWSKWAFEWSREDLDWKPVDRNDRMLLRLKVYRFLFLPYIFNTLHRSLFPHRFYFSFLILRNTYRYCCLWSEGVLITFRISFSAFIFNFHNTLYRRGNFLFLVLSSVSAGEKERKKLAAEV